MPTSFVFATCKDGVSYGGPRVSYFNAVHAIIAKNERDLSATEIHTKWMHYCFITTMECNNILANAVHIIEL